jgi:hypothetical protein
MTMRSTVTEQGQHRKHLTPQGNLLLTVGLVDACLVLFQNLFALQLLCRSDKTVLWRPFLVRQHYALDDLDARKTASLALSLQLLENSGFHVFLPTQLFQGVALDVVLLSDLLESGLLRHDDGDRFSLVLCSVDTDVANNLRGAVNGFKL